MDCNPNNKINIPEFIQKERKENREGGKIGGRKGETK